MECQDCKEFVCFECGTCGCAGWYKCSDRLPEKDQEVLTWDGKWITQEKYDYDLDDDICFSQSGTSATHWMPLPLPPKDK